MIVADANTIAYLYLPTAFTDDVAAVLRQDAHWTAPLLWRSEFRNVLALYLRKNLIDVPTALAMQSLAEQQFADREFSVSSSSVLTLAHQSACSAYDCEYVSLAMALNAPLITADRMLLKVFPDIAMTPDTFLRGRPHKSHK